MKRTGFFVSASWRIEYHYFRFKIRVAGAVGACFGAVGRRKSDFTQHCAGLLDCVHVVDEH